MRPRTALGLTLAVALVAVPSASAQPVEDPLWCDQPDECAEPVQDTYLVVEDHATDTEGLREDPVNHTASLVSGVCEAGAEPVLENATGHYWECM